MTIKKLTKAIYKRLKRISFREVSTYCKLHSYWNKRHDFYLPPQAFGCSLEEYEKQKAYSFPQNIKFSILVPLYNTPEAFLKEMIGSVIFQTYENWELCLADGSDENHKNVEEVCRSISNQDKRIKYLKLSENKGISENTNACIKMATGDFISLFDHDDLLHPCALFETMKAICEKEANFVYTDEVIFQSPNLQKINNTNFKPDFAPDYFCGTNYLCHFSSFKKTLLDSIGNFDSTTDGAQDYDLFLRLSEKAQKIVHVSKCMYYWRASSTSTANSIGTKTYAIEAGKRALEKHYKRIAVDAEVQICKNILYRTKYKINSQPKISIILINKNKKKTCECINSILKKTTYSDFEILVVDKMINFEALIPDSRIHSFINKNNIRNSELLNQASCYAKGEYLVFLDSNTKIISSEWLEEMLMFAQRTNTGAVGAKLINNDETIHNAGVFIGIHGLFGISHKNQSALENGYAFRTALVQNFNAVTAECMMVSKKVFIEMKQFSNEYNDSLYDIDFCLKLRKANYLVVWTPFSQLKYLGRNITKENNKDKKTFINKWYSYLHYCDEYYNPNLTKKRDDFRITGMIYPKD